MIATSSALASSQKPTCLVEVPQLRHVASLKVQKPRHAWKLLLLLLLLRPQFGRFLRLCFAGIALIAAPTVRYNLLAFGKTTKKRTSAV